MPAYAVPQPCNTLHINLDAKCLDSDPAILVPSKYMQGDAMGKKTRRTMVTYEAYLFFFG